jgi:hypothetical protein
VALAVFEDICIDASSPGLIEPFWAAALGWKLVRRPSGAVWLEAPGSTSKLWVNEVPEPRTVKQRVHLDIHCSDVTELLALGATVLAEPAPGRRWWVLADPEGGELCAFARDEPPQNRLYELVVDAVDALAIAQWWAEVFGVPANGAEYGAYLESVPGLPAEFLVFQDVPEPKRVKNRVHWDVGAESPGALPALVERGATVVREPTDDDEWHVMADPEGNEFCLMPD